MDLNVQIHVNDYKLGSSDIRDASECSTMTLSHSATNFSNMQYGKKAVNRIGRTEFVNLLMLLDQIESKVRFTFRVFVHEYAPRDTRNEMAYLSKTFIVKNFFLTKRLHMAKRENCQTL